MQKTLILILFTSLIITFQTRAQIRKIPAEVTSAFGEKYPDAGKVEWKDKLTFFLAGFEEGDQKKEARFSNKGEWLQTETESDVEELPAEVRDGLDKSKYADWEISKVYLIELPENGIQYRVVVEKGDIRKKNLLFSEEGRLLKDKLTL